MAQRAAVPDAIGRFLLALGALVILFGAGWRRIRRLIVGATLPTSLLDKLPPFKV